MLTLEGKYSSAKIFIERIEQDAIDQIFKLCNHLISQDSNIAIMPNIHINKSSTVGITMTIMDKVVPNLVGIDIGCGVRVQPIKIAKGFDWINEFDKKLRVTIPSGNKIRNKAHKFIKEVPLCNLKCPVIDFAATEFSLGTLGADNHYVEVSYDELGRYYLTVHSGSRNLSCQITKYYQSIANEMLKSDNNKKIRATELTLKKLQSEQSDLELIGLKQPKRKYIEDLKIDTDLAYLDSTLMDDYLHDMNIVTEFAYWNRKAIIYDIVKSLKDRVNFAYEENGYESFDTIHNYIDLETNILRKGAISANKDELLIIPLNMRDGSIIAVGKGNADWNYSAPHGAGRIMNHTMSKQTLTLSMFKKSMRGIHSTSICSENINGCCFVYQDIHEIIDNIKDTVEILRIIKPIYNFKAK